VVRSAVKGLELVLACTINLLKALVVEVTAHKYILYMAFGSCFGCLVGDLFDWLNLGARVW